MNIQQNKELILRYNKEVIEGGNMETFKAISHPNFVNHSTIEGMDPGYQGMIYFFSQLLHPAFPDLKVEILDMIAEGNKVTTRKKIRATHLGNLMGIEATGKLIEINIIDIIMIEDGLITAHWGENNFPSVIQSLKS